MYNPTEKGGLNVSYRVFNCILVHFIPLYLTLSFTSFYSFTGIYIFIPLPAFIFYSFIFFILFYFCLLFFLVVLCTSVGGTVPRGGLVLVWVEVFV